MSMEIGIYNEIATNDGNIIRLVESIFSLALQMQASDIHIEPLKDYSRVRVRRDGSLLELCSLPIVRHNAIISRIKLLANMDIAEKRLPQDGRLALSFQSKQIDLRVASLSTILGEKLAIRVLDKSGSFLELERLGFSEQNLEKYNKLIHMANGLILITGATGCGKTTTLYATLSTINNKEKNIITLEDPVEYFLEGVNQVAVNKKAGLDFNVALKSIVRQDPNIIMLGEIRDPQTAEIAIHAALTGHLVFSTLHTNSALGAIARLIDMGIEPYLLLSALRGVVAQRLVRRICHNCGGKGCQHCYNTGFNGRISLQELLLVDDGLKKLVLKGAEESEQLQYLYQQGFKSLLEDGLDKVKQGLTTREELLCSAIIE